MPDTPDTAALAAAQAALGSDIETVDVVFTQPRALGGVDYPAGPRAVPVPASAIEADRWFYDACLADGSMVESSQPRAADGTPRSAPARKTTGRR